MPCCSFLGPAAGRLTCIAVSLVRLPDTLGDLVSRASYRAKCPRRFLCVDFTLLVSPLPGQPEAKSLPQFVGLAANVLLIMPRWTISGFATAPGALEPYMAHRQIGRIATTYNLGCPGQAWFPRNPCQVFATHAAKQMAFKWYARS